MTDRTTPTRSMLLVGLRSPDQPEHQAERQQHDRHVDQEDRAPPEVGEEHAAGDRADGDGDADSAGPDADGLGLLLALEDVHEDGEGGRHHEGGAEAHQCAEDDELDGVSRPPRPARSRCRRRRVRRAGPCGLKVAVAEEARGEQQPRETSV